MKLFDGRKVAVKRCTHMNVSALEKNPDLAKWLKW
jgi:hypothetical protein